MDDIKYREHITPVCEMGQFTSMTTIIDNLYTTLHTNKEQLDHLKKLKDETNPNEDKIKDIYEGFFLFATMWAFGASLGEDDKPSWSNAFKSTSRIKFPDDKNQCFDFYFDPIEMSGCPWKPWAACVKPFETGYEGLFTNLVVPTAETTRQKFLLDIHLSARKGMLYVGSAGTGKTTIIKDYFADLNKEETLTAIFNCSTYTFSKKLQEDIESYTEKKAGRNFGPRPPSKALIYFMDDLNMPFLDKYGTQAPICLVRQIIDYGLVYDRDHLEEKKYLQDIIFAAAMNPKSGSFVVDLRLTRHMTTVSCLVASEDILKTIYQQILDDHIKNPKN